jgi:hypothetical protein
MNFGKKIMLGKGCYRFDLLHPSDNFVLRSSDGSIYHYRELPKGASSLEVNILHPDYYECSQFCNYCEIGDVKENGENIELPTAERFRLRPVTVQFNPYLKGTPARIFTGRNPALIEVSSRFYQFPKQIRLFILLHEYGHLFYETEWKVDLFALKMFLGQGYNESQAFYALSKVLGDGAENTNRITRLFNTIKNQK